MRLLFTALACLISVSLFGQEYFDCSCEGLDLERKEITNCYSIELRVPNHRNRKNRSESGKELQNIILDKIERKTGIRPNGDWIYEDRISEDNKPGRGDIIIKCNAYSLSRDKKTITRQFTVIFDPRSQTNSFTSNNIRIRVSAESSNISKVAVIGKESKLCDGSEDDGQGLAELVEGELLGIYGVVERKHLEEILDEQRLAMSGLLLEDSDFAQAGCLAGAQGTVLASYGCLQGKTKLQIKLVDCSTSDLYWSATGFDVSEFELMDALRIELGK